MRFLYFLLVGILTSACVALPVPNYRPVTPEVKGKVFDEKEGLVVIGATITWVLEKDIYENTKVISESDGSYNIAPAKEKSSWYFIWLGPGEGSCKGTLLISADGYKEKKLYLDYFGSSAANGICNSLPIKIVDVYLEPLEG